MSPFSGDLSRENNLCGIKLPLLSKKPLKRIKKGLKIEVCYFALYINYLYIV